LPLNRHGRIFFIIASSLYRLIREPYQTINKINNNNIVLVFINKDLFIKKYNIIIKRLLVLKLLHFINKFPFSFITHYFIIKMTISRYIEFILFYIIKLSLLILVILKIP
jgi:hypothetical protein